MELDFGEDGGWQIFEPKIGSEVGEGLAGGGHRRFRLDLHKRACPEIATPCHTRRFPTMQRSIASIHCSRSSCQNHAVSFATSSVNARSKKPNLSMSISPGSTPSSTSTTPTAST